MDYLEGYASSLDMFPACGRQDIQRQPVHALVDDFWQVSIELARIAAEHDLMARRGAEIVGPKDGEEAESESPRDQRSTSD